MRHAVAHRLLGVAALVGLGVGGFVVVDRAGRDDRARLTVVQELPDDVRVELDDTWARFLDRFAGRRSCFDDVTLVLVDDVVGGDARYVVADARIEIAIPTTPERFQESVAHELAHHVEHTCDEFSGLRASLQPIIGSAGSWFEGPTWAETPSEIWAETVVEVVLGERIRHADRITIDPEAQAAIEAWASDREPVG